MFVICIKLYVLWICSLVHLYITILYIIYRYYILYCWQLSCLLTGVLLTVVMFLWNNVLIVLTVIMFLWNNVPIVLSGLCAHYFTTTQNSYLYNLITVQPPRSTRSSSLVTLGRPPTTSLRITDRSFQYASPRLWNQPPAPSVNPALISPILPHPFLWVAFPPSATLTHHSHHPSPLHSSTPGLKLSFSPNLSHHSLPFLLLDWLHGFPDCLPILLSISVFTL